MKNGNAIAAIEKAIRGERLGPYDVGYLRGAIVVLKVDQLPAVPQRFRLRAFWRGSKTKGGE